MEVTSFNFLYMLEMLLPAIGLCIPLKKRKHGMGKAMAIIIVGTCLLGVLPIFYIKYYGTEMQQGIFWVESVILMFVWFVLIWAILIFSIYFCTESSIYEAMYIFALSYGVHEQQGRSEEHFPQIESKVVRLDGDIQETAGGTWHQRPKAHFQHHPCPQRVRYGHCHPGCGQGLSRRTDRLS